MVAYGRVIWEVLLRYGPASRRVRLRPLSFIPFGALLTLSYRFFIYLQKVRSHSPGYPNTLWTFTSLFARTKTFSMSYAILTDFTVKLFCVKAPTFAATGAV
jgi:hypothetical protein